MAHDDPPHQNLRCLQIQLFFSLVLKGLMLLKPLLSSHFLLASSNFLVLSFYTIHNNYIKESDEWEVGNEK